MNGNKSPKNADARRAPTCDALARHITKPGGRVPRRPSLFGACTQDTHRLFSRWCVADTTTAPRRRRRDARVGVASRRASPLAFFCFGGLERGFPAGVVADARRRTRRGRPRDAPASRGAIVARVRRAAPSPRILARASAPAFRRDDGISSRVWSRPSRSTSSPDAPPRPPPSPRLHQQPSQKTFKIKKILGKKQKQNRPIPQWIRMRTGNTIRYVSSPPAEAHKSARSAACGRCELFLGFADPARAAVRPTSTDRPRESPRARSRREPSR